jgi:ribosomal protein S18 acetylase RimI-like enzyme
MMQIIEETFSTREDPDQLQVDEAVIAGLQELHPATVSEFDDGNGPAIWVLIFPTIADLMEDFLSGKISEQELFERTKPGMSFDSIYLCSATVLPEYRRQGRAKKMTLDAIAAIRKDFKIDQLFVWPFSEAGKELALAIGEKCGLDVDMRN